MNTLRKILNTFLPIKNDVNADIPLLPEKRSFAETDLEKESPVSEIGVNSATPQTMDTNVCLKEFDDILEEINKDVTKGASLDDIDDVLKDMAQEDAKDLMFEVPRFDLAEISAAYENFKEDDIELNSLFASDNSFGSLSGGYVVNSNEVIEQNDVISISSEDSQPEDSVKNYQLTKNTGNIEQNIFVNSTNTEETNENINYRESIKCVKFDKTYDDAEKDQRVEKQTTLHEATNELTDKTNEPTDKPNETIDKINEPTDKTNEPTDKTNEPIDRTNKPTGKTNEPTDKTNEPTKTNEPADKTNEGIQNNLSAESSKEENYLTRKTVVFMDDSDDCGYQSSDFEFITEEEANMDGLITNFKKNTHKRKATHRRNKKTNRKSRKFDKDPDWAPKSDTDSISDDEVFPDDRGYLSSISTRSKNNDTLAKSHGRNNYTLAKSNGRNNYTLAKSPGRNNTVTFSLRKVRLPPKTNNSCSTFRSSDTLTSRNITEYHFNVIQNSKERDNPDRNNVQDISNKRHEVARSQMECNNERKLLKTKTDDVELALINHPNNLPKKLPDSIKIMLGSSFVQDNGSDSNNMVIKTNEMQGAELINIGSMKTPEKNNFAPSHSQRSEENKIPESSVLQESHTDSNNIVIKTNGMQEESELNNLASTPKIPEENNSDLGASQSQKPEENIVPGIKIEGQHSPSGMQEIPKSDSFDPSSFKRNRSKVDEIEKWRMYQMRSRVDRSQFIVDYSYRDHHRIYQDNDLHQLFDPNRAPVPTARSIRLLENKSTVCKNSMLVEYQGVGFDVPLRDSGSEDDEVKREANECAQKIQEMYPEQNPRRLRRRRF